MFYKNKDFDLPASSAVPARDIIFVLQVCLAGVTGMGRLFFMSAMPQASVKAAPSTFTHRLRFLCETATYINILNAYYREYCEKILKKETGRVNLIITK